MRAGAGPPPAGPGVMPAPARRSRSTGGGVLARPGRAHAGPRARGTGPSPGAPPRTGVRGRPGAAGVAWLGACQAGADAAATLRGRGPLRVPLPPQPRGVHTAGATAGARRGPGGRSARPSQARPGCGASAAHKGKGRRPGGAARRRHPIRGRERVGGGAAPPMAGPWGVARR